MKRYSQMTRDELQQELKQLEQQRKDAKEKKWESQLQILEQKINLARAYLINPNSIKPNTWYCVEGRTDLFHVDYLKGVFAWGTMDGSTEQIAFPISLLKASASPKA